LSKLTLRIVLDVVMKFSNKLPGNRNFTVYFMVWVNIPSRLYVVVLCYRGFQ